MSLYTVHFKWKDKEIKLNAQKLDLTHPYFVSIKDLVFDRSTKLIIDPAEDDIKKDFGDTDHIMIPFQVVTLIEEKIENEDGKVMPFTIVDEKKKKG